MRWFGPDTFAPMCDDLPRVPIPVGTACGWCAEPIEALDAGVFLVDGESPFHHACFIRQIAGSVAHQQRRCSCYGGRNDEGENGVTKREAARAAAREFYHRWGG